MRFASAACASQWLGAQDCFAGLRRQRHRLFVQMIRQANNHDIRFGVVDSDGHIRRGFGDVPFFGELPHAFLAARVNDLNLIASSRAVERHRVKHADKAATEHGYFVHLSLLRQESPSARYAHLDADT